MRPKKLKSSYDYHSFDNSLILVICFYGTVRVVKKVSCMRKELNTWNCLVTTYWVVLERSVTSLESFIFWPALMDDQFNWNKQAWNGATYLKNNDNRSNNIKYIISTYDSVLAYALGSLIRGFVPLNLFV